MNISVKFKNGADWIYGDLIQITEDTMPVRCHMTGYISDKRVLVGVVLEKSSGTFHVRTLDEIKYRNNREVK